MVEHILHSDFEEERTPTVVSIGNFDGCHIGHQKIIKKMIEIEKERNLKPIVITFTPHPVSFFNPKNKVPTIVSNSVKKDILKNFGVKRIIIQKFDKELADISAVDFLNLLKWKLKTMVMVIGDDFHFGKGGAGSRLTIENAGIEVEQLGSIIQEGERIGSSGIRSLINMGDIEKANELLSHPFSISGKVIKGFQRGRKLGFPTANINIFNDEQIIPQSGIYITNVKIKNIIYPALTSVGHNPTFGDNPQSVETFIINFNKNIYDETIEVLFLKKIRDELKFNSADSLVIQMNNDLDTAKDFFAI